MITLLYFLIGLLIGMVTHRKGMTDEDMSITILIVLIWWIAVPVWAASRLIQYNSRG